MRHREIVKDYKKPRIEQARRRRETMSRMYKDSKQRVRRRDRKQEKDNKGNRKIQRHSKNRRNYEKHSKRNRKIHSKQRERRISRKRARETLQNRQRQNRTLTRNGSALRRAAAGREWRGYMPGSYRSTDLTTLFSCCPLRPYSEPCQVHQQRLFQRSDEFSNFRLTHTGNSNQVLLFDKYLWPCKKSCVQSFN